MVVHLSVESEQLVREMLEDGQFASEGELIGEALRLLEERQEQAKLEALRREIAIGVEEADRGDFVPFDPEGILARVRARRAASADQS